MKLKPDVRGRNLNRSKRAAKYFAFAPVYGPGTAHESVGSSPRIFQVLGNRHRCRPSINYPPQWFEVDCKISPGGMEVVERYRADPRTAEHIGETATQLETLATSRRLRVVHYLLGMLRLETHLIAHSLDSRRASHPAPVPEEQRHRARDRVIRKEDRSSAA
jgi:hypothetical protein